MQLAQKINNTIVAPSEVALFYLGQAGFCIKTSKQKLVLIDAYFSDAAERLFHFKRMIPAVLHPHDVQADLFLSTHSHVDHLDVDALPVVMQVEKTFFVGSPDCETVYLESGIPHERYCLLSEGEKCEFDGVQIRAVFADHGDLAPEALGLLLEMDGIKICHVGDTAYAPEKLQQSLDTEIDILIAPINGQFGNMNAKEAALLTGVLKPKIVIASHFWMFLEHVSPGGEGDPTTFLRETEPLLNMTTPMVMAPGEFFMYCRQ